MMLRLLLRLMLLLDISVRGGRVGVVRVVHGLLLVLLKRSPCVFETRGLTHGLNMCFTWC